MEITASGYYAIECEMRISFSCWHWRQSRDGNEWTRYYCYCFFICSLSAHDCASCRIIPTLTHLNQIVWIFNHIQGHFYIRILLKSKSDFYIEIKRVAIKKKAKKCDSTLPWLFCSDWTSHPSTHSASDPRARMLVRTHWHKGKKNQRWISVWTVSQLTFLSIVCGAKKMRKLPGVKNESS